MRAEGSETNIPLMAPWDLSNPALTSNATNCKLKLIERKDLEILT
jgi:hypothetical protein